MNELKNIRLSLNITQAEAARILDVSRRSYQKYEALNDDNDKKLKYYVYRLSQENVIDEEHGVLSTDVIKDIVREILPKYGVNFCYLFGSYAKGKATPLSDVDLLIDTDVTGLDFFGMVEELRQALRKKVDLLNFNQLNNNTELTKDILKEGIKIYG
ncbi:MAG: nucleotidyltransferase domain-containing protein [Clostridia bacterium]|nr:nucleotidyltransferase domain-containing protein [Clostridia bacterium]